MPRTRRSFHQAPACARAAVRGESATARDPAARAETDPPPRARRGGGSPALADRRRVLQAALAPERVEATLQLQGRLRAHVALVDVAVVPDLLDDLIGPV